LRRGGLNLRLLTLLAGKGRERLLQPEELHRTVLSGLPPLSSFGWWWGGVIFLLANGNFFSLLDRFNQTGVRAEVALRLGYSYCPEDLWKQAQSLIQGKRWAEAAQLLDVALKQAPRRNICRNFRKIMAICLTKSGQHRWAISEFLKVIKEGGGGDDLYHHLGHAYAGVGSVDQAIQAFKEALRLNPVAKHYICGARLIIQAAKQQSSFQDYLPLARRWADQAARLGASPEELDSLHTALRNRKI
jgi:tetratricopeptide (TPR) repeat protein